jgi:hypothetical protein
MFRTLRINAMVAGQTNVAVAANFTEPANEIAALVKQKTGRRRF